jgi:hypothetical protein
MAFIYLPYFLISLSQATHPNSFTYSVDALFEETSFLITMSNIPHENDVSGRYLVYLKLNFNEVPVFLISS